jgi:hypothetical protein
VLPLTAVAVKGSAWEINAAAEKASNLIFWDSGLKIQISCSRTIEKWMLIIQAKEEIAVT